MKITIMEQSFTFPNEIRSIETCLYQIEEIIKENEVYLEFMEFDGVEVYEGFQDYMVEHIQAIAQINVKVQTLKQLLDDSVVTMRQYLINAIPEVKKLAEEFYQGVTSKSWDRLNQLLEGLTWITQTIETINSKGEYQNSSEYAKVSKLLHEELSNLEDALKNEDLVLTGDIIKYEVVSILDQLLLAVTTTIDNEVQRNDLS